MQGPDLTARIIGWTIGPMMFGPIVPRESAVDACAGTLRSAILRGEIKPGERLPTERALTASFGVNRATVRGALAKLASARLLSVRQGSGYLVRDFRRDGGPDLLPALLAFASRPEERQALVGDLLLVRRAIAGAVLQRIVEQRDATGIAAIEAAVAHFAGCVERGATASELAEADVAIVAAILDATRSPVLRLCINPVIAMLRELPALSDLLYRKPGENLAGWRALVAWLRAGDAGSLGAVLAVLREHDERAVARIGLTQAKEPEA